MKHGLSSRAAKMAADQQLPIDIHYNKLLGEASRSVAIVRLAVYDSFSVTSRS